MTSDASPRRGSPKRRAVIVVGVASIVCAGLVGLGALLAEGDAPSRCVDGLVRLGARCCGAGQRLEGGACVGVPSRCGPSQAPTTGGCVPVDRRVVIPGGRSRYESIDWEAEGRAPIEEVDVRSFAIDAFEVTWQRYGSCVAAGRCADLAPKGEPGQPVTRVTAAEASAYCAFAEGRLPSSRELLFAAAGRDGRRFAWGPNGAVCRRAAWGMATGPCDRGGAGPELAGSRPEGRSPEGVDDLAGNVAEWTEPTADGLADVRGGSFRDSEPSALKTWARRSITATSRLDDVGFRCVYLP